MEKDKLLLLDGGMVITVDAQRRVLRDGAVLLQGNKIAFVGEREAAHQLIKKHLQLS